MKRKIICIVGPTASGKTGLAIELAKKFNGEIVSADSRQVYRGLDIGTNKDLAELSGIDYHLIDVCDAGKNFTLFDWLKRTRQTLDEIWKRGNVPIIVGGTGLYLQALVEGFLVKNTNRKANSSSGKLINYSRKELEKISLKKLQEILKKIDKEVFEKIDKQNPYRLVRAIEKAQEGTKVYKQKPDFESLQIGITIPRPVLYQKIDTNVDKWFEVGLVEEIGGLLNSGISPDWLESIGLNYRLTTRYFMEDGNDLDNLKQEIKFKTHAYARRQLTWFRRFHEIKWIKDKIEAEILINNFLKSGHKTA